MDQLWAPWRENYVRRDSSAETDGGCFVCTALSRNRDEDDLIVARTAHSAVMLNRYPYNNGHLLIVPNSHKADLADLTTEETLDLMATMRAFVARLRETMNPDGFNVGLNLGRAAGAGLPGHLHWHVVPRWDGDTNFMPVFADVRVMVQSLASLWKLLR